MGDTVACHSGYTYADRPTALWWDQHWLQIDAVLAEWRGSSTKSFRVKAHDGDAFVLIYNENLNSWQIQPAGPVQSRNQATD